MAVSTLGKSNITRPRYSNEKTKENYTGKTRRDYKTTMKNEHKIVIYIECTERSRLSAVLVLPWL